MATENCEKWYEVIASDLDRGLQIYDTSSKFSVCQMKLTQNMQSHLIGHKCIQMCSLRLKRGHGADNTPESTFASLHLPLNLFVLLFCALSVAALEPASHALNIAPRIAIDLANVGQTSTLLAANDALTSNTNSVIHNGGLDENQPKAGRQHNRHWAPSTDLLPMGEQHGRVVESNERDRSHDSSHDMEGHHQADNQSANQSNSFISRAGAGGGASESSKASGGATMGSGTNSTRLPPTSNPNKCNLRKFWRPELYSSNANGVVGGADPEVPHGNEVSEAGGLFGAKGTIALPKGLAPLSRVKRRAAVNMIGEAQQRRQQRHEDDEDSGQIPAGADEQAPIMARIGSNQWLLEGAGLDEEGEENEGVDLAQPMIEPNQPAYVGRSSKQSNSGEFGAFDNSNWPDFGAHHRRPRRVGRRLSGESEHELVRGEGYGEVGVDDEAAVADNQIVWHHRNLMELEDDDLFLVEGSARPEGSARFRRRLLERARHRQSETGRSRRASNLANGVQTIYFGGFFPWLTDDEQVANHHRAKLTPPPTKPPQTSLPVSMINANQERQNNDQQQQSKWQESKQQQQNNRRRQQRKQQEAHRSNRQSDLNNNHPLQQRPPVAAELQPQLLAGAPQTSLQQYENVTLPFTSSVTASSYSIEGRHQLGKFILPAVRLALDHINTNSSVLDSYKLEIVPRDTQCNATISLKEFFDMVYEEPKKMLLYGDACRVSTDPIAKASYFFDLIQISYADTDPIYTIENYPNFFRVVPSENALSLARIPFIRHFNWTRVGTIYQNLPRYSLPHSKLLTDLERFNIVIKQSVSLPGSVDALQNRDLGDELRKLKEKDVRIILGNFDEEWGLLLFCEAYREKMTGRKYQWILTGMSEDRLWQYYKAKGSSCTEQELLIAMDGYIVTDITPVTRSQHPTISGMMAHEYSNEYKRRALEMNISIEENKFYGYVYDGIWAIALALHRVDQQLKYYSQMAAAGKVQLKSEMEGLTSLLDFDYHKPVWVKLIRAALNRTRFNGVTGTVSFYKNERPGLISFSQFQAFRDMSEVIIGSYDALNDNLDLKVGFPIFWRGPTPPIDYTIERVTPFRINRTLFVIISILALFGIVLAIVFLTINIKFRDQRYIKMSSPYLNNLIIIGCILTYTSVIILGLDSGLTSEYNFPYICNARAWVLMAGFTLAFGSMFSKTFRVHSIFTNIKLHKKVIKDYKLFMVVFILLTFDVCILIVWQYFDPFYRETNNGTSIQDSDNEDVIIVPEMEHCQSKRMTIFLSVIYVYKGLLMAFGCFLAWETRHVSIPALNDSKYIGLSVYNVVIMCVIGAGLSFVLRDQQDASFVIISIFIIFCSTTTLCLVFVPKLIELKQNPRAGDHRVRATLKTFKKNYHEEAMVAAGCRDIHGNLIGRGYGASLNDKIKVLLEENVKQRTVLKEKTYELEALTYKYRKIQSLVQSGQYHQVVNSTLTAANSSNLMPIASSTIVSSALPTTVMLTSQDQDSYATMKNDRLSVVDKDKLGLNKSPLMSSTTQITTTNTTSSTNNATELTTDYSSTKLTTTTNNTTNNFSDGSGKRALVAFDKPPTGKKLAFKGENDAHAAYKTNQTRESRPQRLIKANQEAGQLKFAINSTNSQVSHVCQAKQAASKTANDSSYCSMGAADYELVDGGAVTSKSSQDDLNLFTVFSYISNNTGPIDCKRDRRRIQAELAENNFNRWSQGPFCTLMVRNNDQRSIMKNLKSINQGSVLAPGKAVLESSPAAGLNNQATSGPNAVAMGHQTTDETRASCPNLVESKSYERSAVVEHRQIQRSSVLAPQRQLSQPNEQLTKSRTSLRGKSRPLPRTISMIEYLGLGEFDLIASRHDKLLKRRQENKKQPPTRMCCYETCPCCGQMADSQQAQSQQTICQMRCPIQSEGDLAISSSERLNSGDMVQTSSRWSCSTCCSLASQSYASHSELYDETTHSSQTITSDVVDSSASAGSESTTQTSSSSSSSSPFVVSNINANISPGANEYPLCTSGVLYCSSASKEDANGAAQLASPQEDPAVIEEHDAESFISIKCDVLESL